MQSKTKCGKMERTKNRIIAQKLKLFAFVISPLLVSFRSLDKMCAYQCHILQESEKFQKYRPLQITMSGTKTVETPPFFLKKNLHSIESIKIQEVTTIRKLKKIALILTLFCRCHWRTTCFRFSFQNFERVCCEHSSTSKSVINWRSLTCATMSNRCSRAESPSSRMFLETPENTRQKQK